jgi:hypothetical protein
MIRQAGQVGVGRIPVIDAQDALALARVGVANDNIGQARGPLLIGGFFGIDSRLDPMAAQQQAEL